MKGDTEHLLSWCKKLSEDAQKLKKRLEAMSDRLKIIEELHIHETMHRDTPANLNAPYVEGESTK